MLKYVFYVLSLLLFFSLNQAVYANPPVIWDAACGSGIFNLPNHTCLMTGGGTVTNVTASGPLASSGGSTPNISCQASSGSQAGCLSSADWSVFNSKQNALTFPLATNLGGTGTATTFTQGSVVFAGASGIYSQNNPKFFWDNTNFRLGIGTTTPIADVDVGHSLHVGSGTPYNSYNYVVSAGEAITDPVTPNGNYDVFQDSSVVTLNSPTDPVYAVTSYEAESVVKGSYNLFGQVGFFAAPTYQGSGTLLRVAGNESDPEMDSGHVGDLISYFGVPVLIDGSADRAITNYVGSPVFEGAGTATDSYGLFIEDQTGAGTNSSYNIYSFGASSQNVFEGKVTANNSFQMATSGAQPTCDVSHRGLMWNVQGGAGVADVFQICQKNNADAYAWTTH